MQRRQLTPLEEGLGFQQLQLEFGWPVGKISEYSGFSETTVRDRLRLTQFDKTKVKKAYEERQPKLVEFEALSKVKDEEKRNELLEKIGTFGFMPAVKSALAEEAEKTFKVHELKRNNVTQCVYQLFADSTDFRGHYGWDSKKRPVYHKRPEIIALYTWLESLGYETSQEEKELLDGTHEVFHRKNN